MISDVKSYLCEGFYFSYGYDLTASRQRWFTLRKESKHLGREGTLRSIASDPEYFWNINLYKEFVAQNVDVKWLLPLI